MKQQIIHTLSKYLLNPPIKLFFAMGLAPPRRRMLRVLIDSTHSDVRTVARSLRAQLDGMRLEERGKPLASRSNALATVQWVFEAVIHTFLGPLTLSIGGMRAR